MLEWSNRLVTFNKDRHAKTLTPARRVTNPVVVRPFQDEQIEAEQTVLELDFLVKQKGLNPGDVAILHRTAEQTRPFEEHLRKRQIPYEVVGGQSFFDRKEVKDVLALLRAVASESDDRAVLRIINVPPRGIGQTAVKGCLDEAVRRGVSVFDAAAARADRGDLNAKTAGAVRAFRALLAEFRRKFETARDPSAVAGKLLEAVDYEREIDRRYDDPQDRIARSAGVEAVLDSLRAYAADAARPTLSGYLQETTLGEREIEEKPQDGPGKAVKLMTLHSAKGLEFPRVYLVGLEENVLPHKRSVELGTRAAIEEERRLCYVGLTRAPRLPDAVILPRPAVPRPAAAVPPEPVPRRNVRPPVARPAEGGSETQGLQAPPGGRVRPVLQSHPYPEPAMRGSPGATPITLAVETAGRVASLCLLDRDGETELVELDPAGRRNARTLVPEAVALCERHGLKLADVGLVCVALGPGSFTGLRTGVTFAKTLAFAVAAAGGTCDAVGVPSHLAVRRVVGRTDPPGTRLRVVSDALRGDLYVTDVAVTAAGEPPGTDGPRLMSAAAFAETAEEARTVRYGDAPDGAADASTVLAAGSERWRAGVRDDPFVLVPLYVRRSAAEEQADAARSSYA